MYRYQNSKTQQGVLFIVNVMASLRWIINGWDCRAVTRGTQFHTKEVVPPHVFECLWVCFVSALLVLGMNACTLAECTIEVDGSLRSCLHASLTCLYTVFIIIFMFYAVFVFVNMSNVQLSQTKTDFCSGNGQGYPLTPMMFVATFCIIPSWGSLAQHCHSPLASWLSAIPSRVT